MKLINFIAAVVFYTNLNIDVDAFLPDGKCSFMEYGIATGVCWESLVIRLNRVMMNWRRPMNIGLPQTTEMRLINEFQKTCTDGTVAMAINCQKDVDEKCGGSMVDNAKLKKIADHLCSEIKDLNKLAKCMERNNGLNFMRCLRRVTWKDSSQHVLCNVTESVKNCFVQLIDSCDDNLKPVLLEIFNVAVMKTCGRGEPQVKPCSAIEYTMTSAMCFAPITTKILTPLLDPLSQSGGVTTSPSRPGMRNVMFKLMATFGNLCRLGEFDRAIRCMSRVGQKCKYSFINSLELQMSVKNLCRDRLRLLYVMMCVNTRTFQEMLQCSSKHRWHSDNDELMCYLAKQFRFCYNNLYDSCNDPPKKTFQGLFDLVVPKQCSSVPHQALAPACTIMEFIGMSAGCFLKVYSEVQLVLLQRPLNLSKIKSLCETSLMEDALRCMKQTERMCKYSLVNHDAIYVNYRMMCKNLKKDTGAQLMKCISRNWLYGTMECFSKITVNLGTTDISCVLMQRYSQCIAGNFKNCPHDIKATVSATLNVIILDPCRVKVSLYGGRSALHIDNFISTPPTHIQSTPSRAQNIASKLIMPFIFLLPILFIH